jgi:hypothetical protein
VSKIQKYAATIIILIIPIILITKTITITINLKKYFRYISIKTIKSNWKKAIIQEMIKYYIVITKKFP